MKFNLGTASLLALTLFVGQGFAQDAAAPADQPVIVQPDKPTGATAPAVVAAVPAEVLTLLADTRAPTDLTVEELQARMKQARRFAKDENLPADLRTQLASIAAAAKGELAAREQAAKPGSQPEPAKKSDVATAPAEASPTPPPPAQVVATEQPAVVPVPDEVQALLNDNRTLAELSVEDLQARVGEARKFSKDQGLAPELRDKLKAIVQSTRAEIAARKQAAKPVAPAEPPTKVDTAQAPAPQPAPVAPQAAAPVQPAPIPEEVQALLNDGRAPADLSPEELQLRARAARKFSKDETLPPELRAKLDSLSQNARAELLARDQQQKQATAPAAQPAAPAAPAPVVEAPASAAPVAEAPAAPAPAIVQVAPPPPAADVAQQPPPPPPAPTAVEVKKLDSNAGDPAVESQAKAYLADTTAVDKLSDDELRKRLDDARNLMAKNKLSSATEDAVRSKLKTEREVLRARVAQAEAQKQAAAVAVQQQAAPVPAAPVAGEKAASAAAPAQAPAAAPAPAPITDPAVQKVLAALPPVPPAPPAPPPLPPVAATGTTNNTTTNNTAVNNTTTNNIVVINAATPAPVVLRDQRPPEDLQRVELQRRIQVYDDAQYDNQYDQEYRNYWRASALRDREILRRRMIEERYRRQQQLTLGFSNNNLDIRINIDLPSDRPPPPRYVFAAEVDDRQLEDVLVAPPRIKTKQRYTVEEIAMQPKLRDTVSRIEIDTIRFGYNEAFVREEQLQSLDAIAAIIERIVKKYPNEVFLIEGHTDAPGTDQYNLRLSKLRAEAIKKALVSYYVIPAQNLRTVGLGERFLKIPTAEAEPENRRVSISRITQLLGSN